MKHKEEGNGELETYEPGKPYPGERKEQFLDNLVCLISGAICAAAITYFVMTANYATTTDNLVGHLADRCKQISDQRLDQALNIFASQVRQRCQCR